MNDAAPEAIFAQLAQLTQDPRKIKNLRLLHEICEVQHRSSKDFTIGTVGRLSEAAGGLSRRAFYNAASADYRALLSAWETWSGPKPKSTFDLVLHNEILLRKIHDPALRSLVQGISRERDRIRAELDLLKAERIFSVDMRPKAAGFASCDGGNRVELTPSELEAVKRAVSPDFLSAEGWTEGPHGEVITKSRRRVFEVGFLRALRKLIAATDHST